MGLKVISKDYPSPLCYSVPLLIHALCRWSGWKPAQLAHAADLSLREAWNLTTPGRQLNVNTVERVANAFELTSPQFVTLADAVPLPADRSLTVCPPPVPLVLPAWVPRVAPPA